MPPLSRKWEREKFPDLDAFSAFSEVGSALNRKFKLKSVLRLKMNI